MPDPRPKPLELVKGHRTKAEISVRAEGAKALKSKEKIRCPGVLKENRQAATHWRRLLSVFANVGLDEAFYENVLWRYCLLLAEVDGLAAEREKRMDDVERMRKREGEFEKPEAYFKLLISLMGALDAADKAIAKKRDQLLAIERENMLTVQGKLRAIPKKPPEKQMSGIEAFRKARGG